jgi:hypothetical protein
MQALPRNAFEMTTKHRVLAEVAAQASAMAGRLLASNSIGDLAMGTFVDTFLSRIPLDGSAPSINGIVMLPVLVFGAETAAPMRATPSSAYSHTVVGGGAVSGRHDRHSATRSVRSRGIQPRGDDRNRGG